MILMIDNYDSFTFNIVQYCLELGADIKVIKNDELSVEEIQALNPSKIILSPGPCTPNEAGVCLSVVEHFQDTTPLLGICLGHQSIAQYFGAEVVQAERMMHGKTSTIQVLEKGVLFQNIPSSFTATRYHSLVVKNTNLPASLTVTAISTDDKEIMALEIKDKRIYGVQFHPESILSEYGKEIINNFLCV